MTSLSDSAFLSPYIIAEAGVNHEGSLLIAFEMVRQASNSGAHAIKFQFYKASQIASIYAPAYWDITQEGSTSQYELFRKYDTFGINEYEQISKCCQENNIGFMCSAFDMQTLAKINPYVHSHKVASADITYLDLLRQVASYEKPVIVSTGASNKGEIQRALDVLSTCKKQVYILHCVLSYPTPRQYADLDRIRLLREAFHSVKVGYSDHTLPEDMSTYLIAACLGAVVIEKHFTLDKTLKGNDHYHSMDPADLAKLSEMIKSARQMVLCSGESALLESQARLHARRSAIASVDIPKNTCLSKDMISFKRPGTGIQPAEIEGYIGKFVCRDVSRDEIMTSDMFKD
jgi:N-acetylneuraminate synthase